MSGEILNLLLIDDVPIYINQLREMLVSWDIVINSASTLKEGIRRAGDNDINAVLLDLNLPDSRGIQTFLTFKRRFPSLPIIILSELDDEQLAARAVQLGAQDYLIKSPDLAKGEAGKNLIIRSIHYAIERQRIQSAMLRERNLLELRVADRTSELIKANALLEIELAERKRYEFIVNTSKDLLSLIDRNFCYQAVNDAYLNAQNITRQDIIGKTVSEVWGPMIFETLIKPQIDRGFAGIESKYEGWFNFKTLGYKYFEVSYYPFYNPGREVTHVVVVSRDETTRENAREKLRQHNYRLNILREIDHATLAAKSPEDIIQVALQHYWRLVPYDRADVVLYDTPTRSGLIISGGIRTKVKTKRIHFSIKKLVDPIKHNRPYTVNDLQWGRRLSTLEKDYYRSGMRSYLIAPLHAEGKMIGLFCLGSVEADIYTEEHIESAKAMSTPLALMIQNARLFEQVRAINEHLRSLTSRLVSAQEDERRRISLELHDESGQSLTALELSLALMRADLPDTLVVNKQRIDEAIKLTQATMDQIRALAHNLRPPALDAVGLNQTLEDFCQRVAQQTGMIVDYRGTPVRNLPSHIQISIYRVLQEALTNVIKHAQASTVEVSLERNVEIVVFKVRDDGRGFIRLPTVPYTQNGGIGLIGMQERIDALGGCLEIDTAPGRGTRLTARIPVMEVM